MGIRKRVLDVVVLTLVLAPLSLAAAGCSRLWRPFAGSHAREAAPPAFTRDDAIILAKLEAKSQGIDLAPYTISAELEQGSWWVNFRKPAPPKTRSSLARAWPYRFAVKVAPYGQIELLKQS